MPISSRTAAEVARRHGLGLPDAQALALMADNEDEADDLARQFGATPEADPDILDAIRQQGGIR
jgi:hypothetical protein